MRENNLIAQAERLTSLFQESSRAAFPYDEVRNLLRNAGTNYDSLVPDLDLYFSTVAGYCSWGKRLLTWEDEKVQKAKAYATQGFFDRHPAYRSLVPFIDRSDLAKQLGIYDEMRKSLIALLISLQHRRARGDKTDAWQIINDPKDALK